MTDVLSARRAALGEPIKGPKTTLARSLDLPLTVLFGLGVTIGAGIYVLIGTTAGHAGALAPLAFLVAAVVMAPTAATFAEFATRAPRSAGEAAYVGLGFGSQTISRLVGLLVLAVATIAAAAIAQGSAGYIQQIIPAPRQAAIAAVVLGMGVVAVWGIWHSAALAGLMTVIEIGGLLAIVAAGAPMVPTILPQVDITLRALTGAALWSGGFASAILLAFFAFIGFESLANIAEEVKAPERTLPKAIFITLGLSTILYIVVVIVALAAVPRTELAEAKAPLSLVFESTTGSSPLVISLIAIVATINGIIVQMIMAARVTFGLADQGLLPPVLAHVDPRTQTPTVATALVVSLILALALAAPIEVLAEVTSRLTLAVFVLVNAALIALKRREQHRPPQVFAVPVWVPILGCVLSAGLLIGSLL